MWALVHATPMPVDFFAGTMTFELFGMCFLKPFFSTFFSFFFGLFGGDDIRAGSEAAGCRGEGGEVDLFGEGEDSEFAFSGSEGHDGGALEAHPNCDALDTTMSSVFHWILCRRASLRVVTLSLGRGAPTRDQWH